MAASKLKRYTSLALVCLMLTPVVSFATNDTTTNAVETTDNATQTEAPVTDTATTTTTTTGATGIVKKETGIGFIDKINPSALPADGLTQEMVDAAVDYLVATTAERRDMAYAAATETPKADDTITDSVFDTTKVIDGHQFVCESADYELYLEQETLSIIIRDKVTGTLLRSTLEDDEAYVRSSTAPKYSMLTSGVTILPIKRDPESSSRSGMYDKANGQASSRDASITYDKLANGFVAHLNFDNHKNDLNLTGLNIQFDVKVTLDDNGLTVNIPKESINENTLEDKISYMMGDVYLFPMLGYTDRGDTDGYMILPDANGIIVEFQDFYQDGTAKYKSGYAARVYGSDISFDSAGSSTVDLEKERADLNPVEDIIAPYFGMVHDHSALNDGNHEKDMAVLGFVTKGEYNCVIHGQFNGMDATFENYTYASAIYREIYQQPTDNATGTSKQEASEMMIDDFEMVFLLESGEDANYSGLASKCRDMLTEKGILTPAKDLDYDVRVDFLGLDKENFLLFRRNVVATTVANIDMIIGKLKEAGVNNISAYYDGWQKGGMYNLPNTDFKVDSDLGGTNAYVDLVNKYKDSSVSFSLIQDMLLINETTSNSTFTAMKMINKRTYEETDRFKNVYKTFKYLNPSKTNEYMKTLANNMKDEGVTNITLKGFTNTLSTYSQSSKPYTRLDAMNYYSTALEEISKNGMNVSLDDPSMYLWKYTDEYIGMPIGSSMYVYATEEIPFLTILLKGSMKVYSEYVNFEANQQEFFLKLIETGVYPSFLLTHESPTVLQYTNSSWVFSSDYEQYIDVIAEFNKELEAVNAKTSGAVIVKHEMDYAGEENLTKVTYDNGVVVYVNYSENTVSADGTTIGGLSYKVGEE